MRIARSAVLAVGFPILLASCAGPLAARRMDPVPGAPDPLVAVREPPAAASVDVALEHRDSAGCGTEPAIARAESRSNSRTATQDGAAAVHPHGEYRGAPHWAAGPDDTITVRVDDGSELAGWTPAFRAAVGDALDAWQKAGSPVRFALIGDTGRADVRVHWIKKFDAHYEGWTTVSWDDTGSLISGDVTLAVHSPNGDLLGPRERAQVAMHEVGHVLGLNHSSSRTSIMSPTVRVMAIAPSDVKTLRSLYSAQRIPDASESSAQGGSAPDRCAALKL